MGLFSKKSEEIVDVTIPPTTDKVPLVPFKVLEAEIPFYKDEACTQVVPEAKLCILQTLDPEDAIQELLIVPTRKKYSVGQYVTLLLNNKTLWEDVWFKNAKTGEIQKAFNIHVEFAGEVIEDTAIAAEKDRIVGLEKGVAEKLKEAADRKAVN